MRMQSNFYATLEEPLQTKIINVYDEEGARL
jgi:hypothetical protein